MPRPAPATSLKKLAIGSNAHWYQTICTELEIDWQMDDLSWSSAARMPPFHSNFVTLADCAHREDLLRSVATLAGRLGRSGWSLKDSHDCLNLRSRGFAAIMRAAWIALLPTVDLVAAKGPTDAWSAVQSQHQFTAWKSAWQHSPANSGTVPEQFPDSLLGHPELVFLMCQRGFQIVAVAALNVQGDVVGLSNVFAVDELDRSAWLGCVSEAKRLFPQSTIVGYESGTDLSHLLSIGFRDVGDLSIWAAGG